MKEDVKKLAEMIAEEKGIDIDEVVEKIENKEKEYNGLISKEGAAHIVAKEAGIELIDEDSDSLDIENIVSGMNKATVVGKIERIFEPREFETDNGKGKVANIILRDETGSVRFSLWNEEVEKFIEEERVGVGDTIRIENGYVTEDNRDRPELRLGRSGELKEVDEEIDIEVGDDSYTGGFKRKNISKLAPGQSAEIRGTVVNIFSKSPFFKKCPECGERVEGEECEEHEEFEVNMVISAVVDDGTDSIRAVFFGEQAEDLVDVERNEAWEMTNEGKDMEEFSEKCNEILGKEVRVKGRVKMNDFFGRPEILVNSSERADAREEAKEILESL